MVVCQLAIRGRSEVVGPERGPVLLKTAEVVREHGTGNPPNVLRWGVGTLQVSPRPSHLLVDLELLAQLLGPLCVPGLVVMVAGLARWSRASAA